VCDGVEVSHAIPQNWGAVNDLAFNATGQLLAVAAGKEDIHVWNLKNDTLLVTPHIGHGQLNSCAFAQGGRFLLIGNEDGSIVVLDTNTWLPVGTGSHTGRKPVTGLSVSPRGSFIASSDGTEVLLWQLDPFRPAGNRVQPKGARISAIALSPDGQILATGLGNGTTVLWEAATGQQLVPALEGHDVSYVGSVTFSADGRFLASGSGDKTVSLWSLGQE